MRFLVNTHFHGDHSGGNVEFGKAGSVIIAHDNTFKRLSTEQTSGLTGAKTPPQPPEAWPVITFADAASLHVNGEDIEAVHVANAHTDTDAIIYSRRRTSCTRVTCSRARPIRSSIPVRAARSTA